VSSVVLDSAEWPDGMRVIVRKDARTPAPSCLHNLPLHGFDQNQIWCAIVQLARRTRLRFSAHARGPNDSPWL
jgi:hypothetical protein